MAKKIFLSPSDQKRNTYAVGNTNEAEQCGRIAAKCKAALERCGFQVMVVQYEPMSSKCAKSDSFGADLHVPIHTNGFNGQVAGTRMMAADLKGNGYKAAKAIFDRLAPITPGTSENVSAHPELYEIRVPSAPTAYIEVDFHDNPTAAQWIIDHPTEIGEAVCHGICDYFGVKYIGSEPVKQTGADKIAEAKQLGCSVWALDACKKAIAAGVFKGDGAGNYGWHDALTREQFAQVLLNLGLLGD